MSDPNDSVTRLVGRAFSLLEQPGPSSIDDDSAEAKLAALHWPEARRAVLRAVDWGFAAKVDELPPLETPGLVPDGWSRFKRPTGFLGIYAARCSKEELFGQGTDVPYHLDGENIVAAIENRAGVVDVARLPNPLFIRYCFDEDRIGLFTPEFTEAVTHYLAYLMAPLTSSSTTKAREMMSVYQALVEAGGLAEAQQQTQPSYLPGGQPANWTDVLEYGNAGGAPHLFGGGRIR